MCTPLPSAFLTPPQPSALLFLCQRASRCRWGVASGVPNLCSPRTETIQAYLPPPVPLRALCSTTCLTGNLHLAYYYNLHRYNTCAGVLKVHDTSSSHVSSSVIRMVARMTYISIVLCVFFAISTLRDLMQGQVSLWNYVMSE